MGTKKGKPLQYKYKVVLIECSTSPLPYKF